jgi:hypothetical protein
LTGAVVVTTVTTPRPPPSTNTNTSIHPSSPQLSASPPPNISMMHVFKPCIPYGLLLLNHPRTIPQRHFLSLSYSHFFPTKQGTVPGRCPFPSGPRPLLQGPGRAQRGRRAPDHVRSGVGLEGSGGNHGQTLRPKPRQVSVK